MQLIIPASILYTFHQLLKDVSRCFSPLYHA